MRNKFIKRGINYKRTALRIFYLLGLLLFVFFVGYVIAQQFMY